MTTSSTCIIVAAARASSKDGDHSDTPCDPKDWYAAITSGVVESTTNAINPDELDRGIEGWPLYSVGTADITGVQ